LRIIPTSVVAATLLILIWWNTLSTQTSNNISATLIGIVPSIPKILHPAPKPPKLTAAQSVIAYADNTVATRKLTPAEYYAPSTILAHPVMAAKDTVEKLSPLAGRLHLSANSLYQAYDLAKQLYAMIIEGLIILGLLIVTFSARRRHQLPRRYVVLCIASLVMIALQVILPSDLINYGLLRLIQQSLLVLSVPVVIASFWLLGLFRLPQQWRPRVLAVALVTFFVILSGALPALTGAYKPALPVSNSGFYYDAYYSHQSDIGAEQWLASHVPSGSRVYSDEFSRRQMITYGGIFATPVLVPGAIPIDSYVFLSTANVTTGRVALYYNGNLVFHQVPTDFLNTTKNVVYSSGNVKIYR
jgi:hypothetical protein